MASPMDGELMDVVKGKVQDQKCTANWKVKGKDDDAQFEYYFVAKVPAYALSASSEKPLDVTIRQKKFVISKQLMSHSNKPLAFEWAQVVDEVGNEIARGQTDKDGVLFAKVPGKGKYQIRIIDDEIHIPFDQPDDEIDYEFNRGLDHMLLVKILDPDSEGPLKDIDFEVTLKDGSKEKGKTDEDGLICIVGLEEGAYDLKIKDKTYKVPTVEDEDESEDELPVRLYIEDDEDFKKFLDQKADIMKAGG